MRPTRVSFPKYENSSYNSTTTIKTQSKTGQNTQENIKMHQQTHEKILNFAKYQRNANKNYNEVSSEASQHGHYQKVNK